MSRIPPGSRRRLASAGVVVFAALALGCSESAGVQEPLASLGTQATVDLSGTWQLNETESDRPPMPPDSAGRGPVPGGLGPLGQGPGRGQIGGGKGPGHGPGGPPMAARTLTIVQDDVSVSFTLDGTRSLTFYTDGRVTIIGRDGELEARAGWTESALVIQRTTPRGGTLKETYELAANGSKLYVTASAAVDRQGPAAHRRVYDLVTE